MTNACSVYLIAFSYRWSGEVWPVLYKASKEAEQAVAIYFMQAASECLNGACKAIIKVVYVRTPCLAVSILATLNSSCAPLLCSRKPKVTLE